MKHAHLQGWIPVALRWQKGQPVVDWCYLGQRRLVEPFFDQTVDICMREPFNLLFRQQTPVDMLVELHREQPGLPPRGFVFHMSRCGSTLVAQLLAMLPSLVVLAEPPPLDALLRPPPGAPPLTIEQHCLWLRAMLSALGQPRAGQETGVVVKFDSWSIFDLPLIHQAFPAVPWIFVFRDPVEVLVSHQRERGSQMVPSILDPGIFGLTNAAALQLSLDEYAAHVLTRICAAALEHRALGPGRFVHYPQLPELVWSALLDFFQVPCVQPELDLLRHAARFNAKRRTEHFAADTALKQAAAPEALRQLAAPLLPLYEQLLARLPAQGLPA